MVCCSVYGATLVTRGHGRKKPGVVRSSAAQP